MSTPVNTRGLAPEQICGTLLWRWSAQRPGTLFAELWPDTPPAVAVRIGDSASGVLAYALTAAEVSAARAGPTFGDLYRLCPPAPGLAASSAPALPAPARADSC